MISLKQFLENLNNKEYKILEETRAKRFQELAGIKELTFFNRFAIQLIVDIEESHILLEHEQYKQFRKSTSLFSKHPENQNIPVKAHYHIVDSKSKKEIYAVNMDGTAHHRQNKGYQVSNKEAEELRSLGVAIPVNNIIESKQLVLNENELNNSFSFFIILED